MQIHNITNKQLVVVTTPLPVNYKLSSYYGLVMLSFTTARVQLSLFHHTRRGSGREPMGPKAGGKEVHLYEHYQWRLPED